VQVQQIVEAVVGFELLERRAASLVNQRAPEEPVDVFRKLQLDAVFALALAAALPLGSVPLEPTEFGKKP
jgi:hypothetical protein